MDDNALYFLLVVQNHTIPAVSTFNSWDRVLAAYYTELAYRDEGRTHTLCEILDSDLTVLRREVWPESAPV